ncbi:right-handed parallel beta-helix repeat-containing protein [Cerasicoccus frondis]|uniref:right-handed parallel beta-helix repeat-containing protein n=1 Tax=Cerasicoccus frondis TaxID=490090 RepID=UPI00285253F6|nr:right-handed parallel beta-helix repeat-containing protein [Cerasicoccus frondis]
MPELPIATHSLSARCTTCITSLALATIASLLPISAQSIEPAGELPSGTLVPPTASIGQEAPPTEIIEPTEFTVDLPREPKDAKEASVASFGASPSSPDNWQAFTDAIAFCRSEGVHRLTIPPGVYHFTTPEAVSFENLTDFTLDGQGAELIFQYPTGNNAAMVQIQNCKRVLIEHLTIDWNVEADPVASFTEVVQTNPAERYLDIRFTEWQKFPKRDARMTFLNPIDPQTGAMGRPDVFWAGTWRLTGQSEWLNDNTLRIFIKPGHEEFFARQYYPGLPLRVSHYRYNLTGVKLMNSTQLTLRDVTIHATPGHGIAGGVDVHHMAMQRVRVIRRNQPRHAISSANDQIHLYNTQGFLRFDDCEFADGGDDGINIHENSSSGVAIIDNRTLDLYNLQQWSHQIEVGDEIELRRQDLSPLGYRSRIESRNWDTTGRECRVTLADELPNDLPDDAIVFYRRFDTHNIIVRNCIFRDNRGRGMLAKGQKMLIENCQFLRTQLPGLIITAGSEKRWSEGFGVNNVTIRNNLFDHCNTMSRGYYEWGSYDTVERSATLYLRTYTMRSNYPIFQNVLIENNKFIHTPKELLFISSAHGVTVQGNVFQNPEPHLQASPLRGLIEVRQASDVAIIDNTWEASPHTPNAGILYDPNTVSGFFVKNNRITPRSSNAN